MLLWFAAHKYAEHVGVDAELSAVSTSLSGAPQKFDMKLQFCWSVHTVTNQTTSPTYVWIFFSIISKSHNEAPHCTLTDEDEFTHLSQKS